MHPAVLKITYFTYLFARDGPDAGTGRGPPGFTSSQELFSKHGSDIMSNKIEKPRTYDRRKLESESFERDPRRPLDASELNKLPQPTDKDPPYRSWWVLDRPRGAKSRG